MAPKKFELTEVDREILRSYQYMLDGLALYLGDSGKSHRKGNR